MLYTVPRKLFAHVLSRNIREIPKDGLVLDIGCGLGELTEFVSQNLKRKTVGLDVDRQTCRLASTNMKASLHMGFVLYNGTAFPFKQEAFHLAYAHEVIEHINDDELFLSEIYRILKKGGLLILSTPNAAKEPLNKAFHRDHVRHYTKSALLANLMDAGLSPIMTYWRYHTLGSRIDSMLYRIGSKLLHPKQVQYTMSHWSAKHKSKPMRFILQVHKHIIDPVVTVLILIEFELKKIKVEAASMVVVCRK